MKYLWWAKMRNLGAASAPLAPAGEVFLSEPSACLHAGSSLSPKLDIPSGLTFHQTSLHKLALQQAWYTQDN